VPPVTSGAGSLSWMSRGACVHADPKLFFPIGAVTGPAAARQAEAAKVVCGTCDVRKNCLSFALETMPEGIWGGTTLDERRAVRRRPSRHYASRQSHGPASAAVTGENATCAGRAGQEPVPTGLQSACATQQTKPASTSQSVLYAH
jgi:WhiB family redox-sensing transcriptional regulator